MKHLLLVVSILFILHTLSTNGFADTYFPASVGDTWTYQTTPASGSSYSLTNTVTEANTSGFVTKNGNSTTTTGNSTTQYIYDGGALKSNQFKSYTNSVLSSQTDSSPPFIVLPTSMTDGVTESATNTITITSFPATGSPMVNSTSLAWSLIVNGTETVTVPAGTFMAKKITLTQTSAASIVVSSSTSISTYWYVNNVGRVKNTVYVTSNPTAVTTSVLTAYSVKQTTTPGDCDSNGSVDISEVQSAISMFLGVKQVQTCVDLDKNNSVSIAEVQKTINTFLGLSGTGSTGGTIPTVTGINPSTGAAGITVTISGTNFSTTAANNTVMFSGAQATVSAATATSLSVIVPNGSKTGIVTVATPGGSASSPTGFTVSSIPITALFFKPTLAACKAAGGFWESYINECRATWDKANKICAMPTKEDWLAQYATCGGDITPIINSYGDSFLGGTVQGMNNCMASKGFVFNWYYWSSTPQNAVSAWASEYTGYQGNNWVVSYFGKDGQYSVRCK